MQRKKKHIDRFSHKAQKPYKGNGLVFLVLDLPVKYMLLFFHMQPR